MNSADFTSDVFVAKMDSYLKSHLSPSRYEHSASTADTCRRLAAKFGYDQKLAYFTGLAHDIAREYSKEELVEWASRDGKPVRDLDLASPVLLHGRAGAMVLKKEFGIEDQDVIDALSAHTTGTAGMKSLAKILFVADYIEPKRKHITPEFLASLEGLDLDGMVYAVLMGTLNHLASKGKGVDPEALELKQELEHAE